MSRLLVRALLVFGALWSSASFASFAPPTVVLWTVSAGDVGWHATKAEACQAYADERTAASGTYDYLVSASTNATTCYLNRRNRSTNAMQNNVAGGLFASSSVAQCPANSTESGGECTCDPEYVEEGSTCVPEPDEPPETPECEPPNVIIDGACRRPGCPAPGTPAGGYSTDTDSTQYTCEMYNARACTIRIVPTVCVRYEKDGVSYSSCHGNGAFTGASCWGGGDGGGTTPPSSPGSPTPGPGPNPDPSPDNPGGPGAPDQGPGTPTPSPPLPAPNPVPPGPDDECPAGTTEINGACIQDPESPGGDGSCPAGSVRVDDQCVYTSPPGDGSDSGGSPGSGGDGEGDGDCVPGNNLLKCSTMSGLPGGSVPSDTREIAFAPAEALPGGGSCPSSPTLSLLGTSLTIMDMPQACAWISTYLRPIAIVLSAFMALGIASGALRTET